MSTEAVKRFVALLTLFADLIIIARVVMLVMGRWPAGRKALAPVLEVLAPIRMPAAFAVAATTMAGSLYFSEVAHFTPCKLCWFQRIGLYPVAIILAFALVTRDRSITRSAILLAALTAPISVYHYLIEWYPELEAGSCDPTAPCTAVWFREFGFISLSFMAASSALAIISLLTLPSPAPAADPSDRISS